MRHAKARKRNLNGFTFAVGLMVVGGTFSLAVQATPPSDAETGRYVVASDFTTGQRETALVKVGEDVQPVIADIDTSVTQETSMPQIHVSPNPEPIVTPPPPPPPVEKPKKKTPTPKEPAAKVPAGDAQNMAYDMVQGYGWSDTEFACLVNLWQRESNWNHLAENRSSGAYGIPQSLPGSKMASAGDDWRTNPKTQISWGLGYIKNRYGTPCGAWDHSERIGWY